MTYFPHANPDSPFLFRAEAPKQPPDVEYRFRHIRRDGTPDELPAIPTLAEALGK